MFLIILLLIYPYIISKNYLYDSIYLFLFISGKLSWIFCKDECYISYLFKKVENKDYQLGDNSTELSDIVNMYHNKYIKIMMTILVSLFPTLYAINIAIINFRSRIISNILLYTMLIFYFIYLYYVHFIKIKISTETDNKNIFFINLFKFIYVLILFYIIYNYFYNL
jgi:hypothetical protein